MLLFADTGLDQDEKWPPSVLDQLESFHAFLPNSVEAMAYTHTDDPHDALHALAERVPVAVVTCGSRSPTSAPRSRFSTSADRWPHRDGATSSTGSHALGPRPPTAPATPPNWPGPTSSSPMSCLSPAGSRSAAPGRPSPGSRTRRRTGAGADALRLTRGVQSRPFTPGRWRITPVPP